VNERGVLGICADVMLITAERSTAYPPKYLMWSPLWAGLSFLVGLLCLAAMTGRRGAVVLAGGMMVGTAVSRGVVIAGQLAVGATPGPTRATFTVAAATWLLVAVLSWQVWTHVLVPWAAYRGGRRES